MAHRPPATSQRAPAILPYPMSTLILLHRNKSRRQPAIKEQKAAGSDGTPSELANRAAVNAATFQKLGVFIFVSGPYKRRSGQSVKGRGMRRGVRVFPSPTDYGVSGSVLSSPAGSRAKPQPQDFGAFHMRFYVISRIF